jgi:hypothetical protein
MSFSDSSFRCVHKYLFSNVLSELERKNWTDFDFHRVRFIPTLSKLKNVEWIEVDAVKYEQVISPVVSHNFLRSSTYGHYRFVKCFPTSRTCTECYKYFCICCSEGSNCMFGEKCRTKRCSKMLNSYHPEIYDIESYKKRVFVYTSKKYDFFTDRKESICSREIYGY